MAGEEALLKKEEFCSQDAINVSADVEDATVWYNLGF